MYFRYQDSPIGPLLLAGDEAGLRLLHMETEQSTALDPLWQPAARQLDKACRQLDEYFAGKRKRFDLQLAPQGTEFQRAAWQALLEIPYGQTISYATQALRIGRPKAVRAIGLANGANPIAVIIPCHRVIGRDGSLTGFGGGLERKAILLRLEGAAVQPVQDQLQLI
ncbi:MULTISPECIES: methylated-DNA--[protein]-cysteine S-methyltransferase [unclassified Pseudomonas]|uniref:methylated-DNA--[protein]-cysteine S-methyltransferase n=1 Tax=unclassified Pseudomonas TaxID=196821 RepID=UPI0021DFA9F4|nr:MULTISPECIES: methylated-DNA--[protein]-cysteine S-methyltransferase [unclassified Pseudomonas]MCU9948723.1 methylated-DNA--[protein]-cysteine S-methyltransferase [Pseudomonas sp. PDM13]WCD78343.1 methylated-DNA--[protein]-cysteine S-methyltransferase [Pseudomonas sp. TUM22785]